MEKIITYFNESVKVACDERCDKAWGLPSRPRVQMDPNDENTQFMLADDELGTAPVDPGTYEGRDAKPVNKENIPNKWCVRCCERCAMSDPGESHLPLELKSFKERIPF